MKDLLSIMEDARPDPRRKHGTVLDQAAKRELKGIHYQETSREAWASFMPKSATTDAAIIEHIDRSGTKGMADCEVEAATGISHQTVSGNRRHLVERGLIKPTNTFGRTKSGRKAIRWVCAWHFDPKIHANREGA